MAVAIDAVSENVADTSDTLTIEHTCSGSDRVLYLCVVHAPGGDEPNAVTATYNGDAMDTFFDDVTTSGSRMIRVLRLVAPDTGTHDIVLSWGGDTQGFYAFAASFTGVDQSDPDDAHVMTDGTGGGTSSSRSVTSASGDMVMDAIVLSLNATSLTPGASQTQIHQHINPASTGGINGAAGSYWAGDTSRTMEWSWTGFVSYVHWAWNINASVTSGSSATPSVVAAALTGIAPRMDLGIRPPTLVRG